MARAQVVDKPRKRCVSREELCKKKTLTKCPILLDHYKLRYREVRWEGSQRQNLGPRNTNHIRGDPVVGERALVLEAQIPLRQLVVDVAGI